MDFEQIRLEAVEEFKSNVSQTGGFEYKFIDIIIDTASRLSKEMLIKYDEKLNSK